MKYGHVLDSDEHSASAALEEAIIERRQSRGRRVRLIWRRTADFLGFSLFLVAMALVAVAGWAAGANVAKSGWNSDAAAWVQAAGSIAAIAGAAWLAQSEARRTRKVRREHNEEAAWYVRFAVKQAQFESQIIASELVNRAFPVDKADVREWRQRATTSATSLNALVGRTDHIHPSVTQVISNAKVLMDDLLGDLGELAAVVGDGSPPSDDLRGRIVAPHRAFLDLLDLYDARMRGIRLALDDGGDALPIRSWPAWNPDVVPIAADRE